MTNSTNAAPGARRSFRPAETFGPIIPVGRSKGYELIRTGQLRSVKVGRAILIPQDAIDDFLSGGARVLPADL